VFKTHGDIAEAFFQAVLQQARERSLLFRRALYRGWNVARSVGECEELAT